MSDDPIMVAQADPGLVPRKTVDSSCPARASEAIVVAGRKVPVSGACIVNFEDDKSWDFRRLVHPDPNRQYVYARKGEKGKPTTALLEVQEIVDMVVIHADITYNARTCYNVLKNRGFSTHFMVDWDGTIYQATDAAQRAVHAHSDYIKGVNNRSIGIDMNCLQFNYARRDHASTTARLQSQFSQPGGARRMSDEIDINGVPWKSWGYTEPQYDALIKLLQALGREFPKLKLAAPIDETGQVIWGVPGDEAFGEAGKSIGIWGHMHLTARKFDPGPGFDWQRLVQGLTKEHNRFPVELITGRSIPNLLTEKAVSVLADKFYHNNEQAESGGFYPIGLGGQWHGGLHLHLEEGAAVRAMCEGVVVAARNGPNMSPLGSNNFVLIRHQKEFGTKEVPKTFVFYSLYMHLQRFDQAVDQNIDPRKKPNPKAAPQWVTAAKRIKTGEDEADEAEAEAREKKNKKRRKKKDADDLEDEELEKSDDKPEDDDVDLDEDIEEDEHKYKKESPFLKVGGRLQALERGEVATFKLDGTDQTKVAAGDTIGRVGVFGDEDGGEGGLLHVEIFADGTWREVVDLLGVHGAHWIEMEADIDDNLTVDTDDLLRLVMPDNFGTAKPKVGDFVFVGKGVSEDDILDFFHNDVGGPSAPKVRARKAITRHVSEWSDKVNWIKSMAGAQGWDEAVTNLNDMLQDQRGAWLQTLFAEQIRRHLPFIWLTDIVAEEVGLEEFDGQLYHFHPIHFLMWLTFHTNTRVRVLAKGRSKKELKRLRKREKKNEDRLRKLMQFEDFDHGSPFEDDEFEVSDPTEVLQDLWQTPPLQGDWQLEDWE